MTQSRFLQLFVFAFSIFSGEAADRACLQFPLGLRVMRVSAEKVLGNEAKKVLWCDGVKVSSSGTCSTLASRMMMMCAPAVLD